MGERLLILSAGVGSGHNSAAEALRRVAAQRPDVDEVRVLDVLQVSSVLYRDLLSKGYFVLADGVPWLVEWGYDVSDPPFRRRGPIDPWTRANALPALREIRRFAPTAIVCTHFLPAGLVASLLLRGALTARTAVVTTDYDFQGLWLTSAFHAFFVARDEGRVQLTNLGLPGDRITASGIPITAAPPVPVEDGPPMLLISAGAAGGDYATAVVRQTLHMTADFTATVVCGRNEELRARIEQLVAPRRDRYRVLGYTTEMPSLLRRASLFVGKPGGLSASECMAAGLPMVLVNPIPGQEVRNGDYLLEQGAAVRCNTASTIGWKIDRLLAEPGRLARMRDAAAETGRPDAAERVLGTLLEGARRPLVITRAAQKTVLGASGRKVVATDLTGPSALARLVEPERGDTVALVRASELDDLRDRYGADDGRLVLRRSGLRVLARLGWEAQRLVGAVLGGDGELEVAVEDLHA
ncbi:MGDG synthase family glycosyltransferase [Amnibacterium endophyticum]|uniref:Glycosyltransferase n=1 Tax=Amnibacterium endophyticum TaxID=2109337 RepID=A0ABW4LB09_9MICO